MNLELLRQNRSVIGRFLIGTDFMQIKEMLSAYETDEKRCKLYIPEDVMQENCKLEQLKELLKSSYDVEDELFHDSMICYDDKEDCLNVVCINEMNAETIINGLMQEESCEKALLIPLDLSSVITADRFYFSLKRNRIRCEVSIYINANVISHMDKMMFNQQFSYIMQSAIMGGVDFYSFLIENVYEICNQEENIIFDMLCKCHSIHQRIIQKFEKLEISDELDPFSFGMDIAKALFETDSRKVFSKGECCSLGFVAASFLSYQKGFLEMEEYYEIRDIAVLFSLPISFDFCKPEIVLRKFDFLENNTKQGLILKKIGKLTMDSITAQDLLKCIEEIHYSEEDID